jgi:hypothetical protein
VIGIADAAMYEAKAAARNGWRIVASHGSGTQRALN